jgi:hypothetical protein
METIWYGIQLGIGIGVGLIIVRIIKFQVSVALYDRLVKWANK